MAMSQSFHVGQTFVAERTFTVEDVQAFTRISGDAGVQHVAADADGRLWVHGLLVASLTTEVGGRIDYLARRMDYEFLRPVKTGDHVRCEVRVDELTEEADRYRMVVSTRCTNQLGKEVMRGLTHGVVLKRSAP